MGRSRSCLLLVLLVMACSAGAASGDLKKLDPRARTALARLRSGVAVEQLMENRMAVNRPTPDCAASALPNSPYCGNRPTARSSVAKRRALLPALVRSPINSVTQRPTGGANCWALTQCSSALHPLPAGGGV